MTPDPLFAWREGWRRVVAAPAILAGVFVFTLLAAAPAALVLRHALQSHLGRSAAAAAVAEGIDYDWWQEFTAQASGLGATFSPAIIGFAATLDNLSGLADGQGEAIPIAATLTLYLAGWTFLAGGIIDRYARQRPTRAHGFFAASGVFFFRLLRLAVAAGAGYWWLFVHVHPWLEDQYERLTRDVAVERIAFVWRLAMYAVFGVLLAAANLLFDYAKIRIVVEDRRSALGGLAAALRFVRRNAGGVVGLYLLNGATFAALLMVWAATAPAPGQSGLPAWTTFAGAQLYVLARLALKLQFLASQTAFFQSRLAHARYTAAPKAVWPESPSAEAVAN